MSQAFFKREPEPRSSEKRYQLPNTGLTKVIYKVVHRYIMVTKIIYKVVHRFIMVTKIIYKVVHRFIIKP